MSSRAVGLRASWLVGVLGSLQLALAPAPPPPDFVEPIPPEPPSLDALYPYLGGYEVARALNKFLGVDFETADIALFEVRRSDEASWGIAVMDRVAPLLLHQATTWLDEQTTPCGGERQCVTEILTRIGSGLLSIPATADYQENVTALYMGKADHEAGLAAVADDWLRSKELWWLDPNSEDPIVRAAQVSYLVTGAPPDDQLVAFFLEGPSREGLPNHLTRLVATPEAILFRERLVLRWAQIESLLYAETRAISARLNPDSVEQYLLDTRDFIAQLEQTNALTLKSLLLDPGAPTEQMRVHYGEPRAGLFQRAAFIVAHSPGETGTPVAFRGAVLLQITRCVDVPDPIDHPIIAPIFDGQPGWYTDHVARVEGGVCAGCHVLLDGPGVVWSKYAFDGSLQESAAPDARFSDRLGSTFGSSTEFLDNTASLSDDCFRSALIPALPGGGFILGSGERTVEQILVDAAMNAALELTERRPPPPARAPEGPFADDPDAPAFAPGPTTSEDDSQHPEGQLREVGGASACAVTGAPRSNLSWLVVLIAVMGFVRRSLPQVLRA